MTVEDLEGFRDPGVLGTRVEVEARLVCTIVSSGELEGQRRKGKE